MSDCCTGRNEKTGKRAVVNCPECGGKGKRVTGRLVRHQVRYSCREKVHGNSYFLCANPGCAVTYFSDEQMVLSESDLAFQGIKSGEQVCFCYHVTKADIRRDIEEKGDTRVEEYIRERVKEKECACEVRNPKGSCCLGDVRAAVKEIQEEVKELSGQSGKVKSSFLGIVAALAALSCCLLPVALGMLALGGAAGSLVGKSHWVLLGIGMAALIEGWRRYRKETCSECSESGVSKKQKGTLAVLLVATAVVGYMTVVSVYSLFRPRHAPTRKVEVVEENKSPGTSLAEWEMVVNGMTCSGCERAVESAAKEVPGVVDARADHRSGKLYVRAKQGISSSDVAASVENAGYEAVVSNSN